MSRASATDRATQAISGLGLQMQTDQSGDLQKQVWGSTYNSAAAEFTTEAYASSWVAAYVVCL